MANFVVSPAVTVKEIDLTNIVPAVSTSIAGYVGDFSWGPVEEITTISDETALVTRFSKPNDDNFKDFLTAASFLQYGRNLKLVRTLQDSANNASTKGGTLVIKNDPHYDSSTFDDDGYFAARFPGALGNSLKIAYCLADSVAFSTWEYNDLFDTAPGTSDDAEEKEVINDEIHIAIVDVTGQFSGIAGTVLERFPYLSLASDAKSSDGATNYFAEVLRARSRFVHFLDLDDTLTVCHGGKTFSYVKENDANEAFFYSTKVLPGSPVDTVDAIVNYQLTGGADGDSSGNQERFLGYDLFKDVETVDVNLLIGGDPPDLETLATAKTFANYIIAIARTRHDSVAFVSPPLFGQYGSVDSVDQAGVIEFAKELTSTSFGVLDSTALKVYDKYNDKYRWISASGHIAGLCAYTDEVTDPWWSPAGLNRGQLLNVTKLAYNPNRTSRDELYKNRVNPLVQFPGQGTVLWGDKTLLARPSAFDRINVRRLFNVLEKAIATAAKFYLFEFNDAFTRASFKNMVEPYLREVKGRRGVYDFLVVCDESNNTPEIIDSNQFVADIYIKPARSINFITLNFIAVRTGVKFEEIIGMKNDLMT
jgi:hypothetical protein